LPLASPIVPTNARSNIHLRFSFATSMEVIEKGVERIRRAVETLD
jgi:aspartate/methionine/tyrosine aminotransferase